MSLDQIAMEKKITRSCLVCTVLVYEALDFLWDLNFVAAYYGGEIFYGYKESLFITLLVLTIVGYIISLLFLLHFALTPEKGDGGEGLDGTLLRLQSLNVALEALPQSVVAKFCFDRCPTKDGSGSHLVPGFHVFIALSSIIFFVFLAWFCFKHSGWTRTTKVCSAISYVFALLSLIFTTLALYEYYHDCSLD